MRNANDIQPVHSGALLVVDNVPVDQQLLLPLIHQNQSDTGIEILQAESCEQALAILRSKSLCCCLVSDQLTADGGLVFLKELRRAESGEDIPVIVMTDSGDEQVAAEVIRNGAQDYLVKGDITAQTIWHSIHNAIYTCELQAKLRRLAHSDDLTGLLNRSLFLDRLQTAIDQCDRYQQSCSLLYIDVDNFKQVNDQYGHDAGDLLLKTVGERIRQNCRISDSAARLGGDEFAILLGHINEVDTHAAAEKILQKVSEPVVLDAQNLQVSLSIGIAHYPDTAKNLQELMKQADEAMYRAKQTGKARYFQFTEKQKQQWDRRSTLEALLPAALENNELTLAYQPIINTHTDSLHSLEVLVRWFPVEHVVTATEVMEMIERLGLFDAYHRWLVNAALSQLHQWQQQNIDLQVALNIPVNQCRSELMAACLQEAMARYSIRPEQIELEIKEKVLMKNPALSAKLLQAMKNEGIRTAIDDFGAGHSSMAYLTTLPLDALKIDQRFFIGMDKNYHNRKVVDAVTALGHSLGLQVVAEGVQSKQQYLMAKETGCDLVQGYYLGRPQLAVSDWASFWEQFAMRTDLQGANDDIGDDGPHQTSSAS